MPNFIDCWALVSGKGYKHKDGSEVVNTHDRAAILERINEHVKSGLPPAEAARAAIKSHIAEADGQLNSIYEQVPGLKPKEAASVEATPTEAPSPLPEQFQTKPIAETADLVKGVTTEDLAAYKGTAGAGPTGFMWDVGSKAKTEADVAALRKIGEEASAETKALMAKGDFTAAMKVIGRQPAEAYEYATGVKLDGTPKWEVLEKMAAMKGQTYKPPVPDPQYVKAKGGESVETKIEKGPQEVLDQGKAVAEPALGEATAVPSSEAIKSLPPIPAGHVRLFHGEGGPQGGGTGGAFYTSNIAKASTFGPDISWVDLPTSKAQAAFAKAKESAFSGGDNFILEAEDISRSKKIGQKVEPPTHVLDEPPAPPAPRGTQGIAASVRKPGGLSGQSEAGAISLVPLQNLVKAAAPPVKAAVEAVKDIAQGAKETGKEALTAPRMTDYRRSVLNWSAKLQKSFGEAATAQKDIQTKVPDAVRREAITNWIQANGDAAVLRQRAAATTDPKLRKGYEAALTLTPEELAVANQVKQTYDTLGQRGQAKDVLDNFKDNYVTQIWDLGKTKVPGSSRTLKEKFKFSKASTFPTFFDGEQAGYVPKTKDISKLLPVYTHEMNSVIAARELVQQMSKGRASDGRQLVAPRGTAVPAPGGGATLVLPKKVKGDTSDYKVIANQPALNGWRWASKDSAGNPIFLKGDLALHPEAANRLKNVLGRSAIREWYTTPTTRTAAIPKAIVRGIDFANSETKRTMLGLLAPFHQVQTGTHAVGHRVNPFGNIPKIDLVNNRPQMDAARHGLMLLPDRVSEGQFMEGFKTSGLVSKIPGLGPLSDMYASYLFKDYIPGLKMKTYDAILARNNKVYADELSSGRMKPEDVKVLSAEQANAAYGHLNYADLGRNPTLQHMAQIGLLAPDFLEARGRFFGQALKGATGAKVGREQLIALATLAVAQASAAFISAKLSGGEWDTDDPFAFHVGSRKYTMRSVPEDVTALLHNTRTFVHSRLSPIVGKGTLQYLSGTDYAGRKVTAGQTTKELLTQPIPLTARSLPGVRSFSGQDRPGAIKAWEQLAGAVGLKISRYNPRTKINELHADWLKNHPDPKVKADYEQQQTATFPISKYKALDSALSDRDEAGAILAIGELKAEGQKNKDILKRMRPFVGEGINSRAKPLFHESHKLEASFKASLTPDQRKEYQKAIEERKATYQEFLKAWRKRDTAQKAEPKIDFVPDAGQ